MDSTIYYRQFGSLADNGNHLSYLIQLPDPEQIYTDVYDLSFPQVTAFVSAVLGVVLVGLIVSALRG